jgi:DNA-binding CsgD family transcriptional regulator
MEIHNRLLLDFYDSAQHCKPAEFNEDALNRLKRYLGFESAALLDFSVSHDQKFVIQTLYRYAAPLERFHDRPKVVGDEAVDPDGGLKSRDAVLQTALTHRGRSVTVDVAEKFTSPDILAYCRRYETAHSLTFVSAGDEGGRIPTVALWRAAKANRYLRQHEHAADIVLPHLFKAREICRRLSGSGAGGARGRTTALCSPDGCLHVVEPETIRLLQLEWKQWTPPFLPAALLDSLKRNEEKTFLGKAIHVKAVICKDMISLTIEARNAGEAKLTEAEYRAAKLAAMGLQYKEIARQHGLSPATVRNQLHSAYSKLGVSNKTELATILGA